MSEGKKQSTLSGVTRERVLCYGLKCKLLLILHLPKSSGGPFPIGRTTATTSRSKIEGYQV